MSRNTESHFGNIPLKNMKRSAFKMPCSHKTTFSASSIVPIYRQEVLPGDTCKMKLSSLVRMATPLAPTMDNAWLDTYFFFVPRRLVWEHWKQFMGENTTDAWTEDTEYTIPQLNAPEGGWAKGTIAQYLGARIGVDNYSIDACYTRAYTLIYNEWFRSQNVSEPADLSTGDADTNGSNGTDYVNDLQKGGYPAKAVKYADYFTRALPEPQKGPDIYLPLGTTAPLIAGDAYDDHTRTLSTSWVNANGETPTNTDVTMYNGKLAYSSAGGNGSLSGTIHPNNLYADLSEANAATINQLRQAFAIQRMYEIDARGGRAKACASSIKKSRKKTGRLNRKAC